MTYISLLDVNEIYSCSSGVKIIQHQFEHREFWNFCLLLTNFEKSLGENAADDYWQKFLPPLKQYRFKLCAAPLPFNHPTACQPETIQSLEKHLKKCRYIYPDFTSAADNLFKSFALLSQSNSNPLLDFLVGHYSNIVLLLQNLRLIPPMEDILATIPELGKIEILIPSQLRGKNCVKKLVVIGAMRWFPDYIFTAPHSQEIDIIQYKFLNDRWQYKSIFLNSINNKNIPIIVKFHASTLEEKIDSTNINEVFTESIDSDEVLPLPINLSQIAKRFTRSSLVASEEEYVEARLFLLEGETAVFLDANVQQHIIDLQEHGEDQVKKIDVTDIELDMFIILRTSGGGDYIIPLANSFLGAKAQYFRELQEFWKISLKRKVRLSGLNDVSWKLINLGSKLANKKHNIRNWMSYRSIRPDDDKDFNAILNLVGLSDRLTEFYEAASLIDNAHRKAGYHIRKLLLDEIRKSNFIKLEQQGKIHFQISEATSGSMTAFRVVGIHTEITRFPYSKIAHPFQLNSEIINA
ncbi:hypothetical protein [Scytonema sp. NUACC26]|uniref:DISARM anti-phage system protein DrmE domain-containing protein n=1 Tax=Scytonema sp. NUACC26 TaxID=3140176 RepID=UPI0034DC0850